MAVHLFTTVCKASARARRHASVATAQQLRSATLLASWLLATSACAACNGPQSALAPAGEKAEVIADLFWLMTIAGTVIFCAFLGLTLYAVYFRREAHSMRFARGLIVWGAVVIPTVLLAALLVYGLRILPSHLAPAPEASLRIHVWGHQWWWRVRYEPANGAAPVESANEIRLPANVPVQFELESPDVIHSFWIPNLAGKVDMIPGRKTQLALTAQGPGEYRGACAEYCGTSHAWMAFPVVVLDGPEFERWLEGERGASAPPTSAEETRGRDSFLEHGCGACHTVRGTSARGVIGPDLTHVGGRRTIGAGLFETSVASLQRWIAATRDVKPGVHMPAFGMLPADELRVIASYLESLK
jgi:cytochrome c oxidase subunit II